MSKLKRLFFIILGIIMVLIFFIYLAYITPPKGFWKEFHCFIKALISVVWIVIAALLLAKGSSEFLFDMKDKDDKK
jgi:uncharacterized membrane protein